MSKNKICWKRVIGTILIIVALLIFATWWSQTHQKKSDDTQTTEQTTSVNDNTPTDVAQTSDATASTAQDESNVQKTIDSLNQQIADKDASISDLNNQVSELQNGVETKGGLTFQEFLDLYFWSDGNTYRLLPDRKLYSDYSCTKEYELNSSDYTFRCNYGLPLKLDNGLTINMVMTTDGQVLWSPDPYFERIDGQCIFREALYTSVCGAFPFVNKK